MKAAEKLYFDSFRQVVKAVSSSLELQHVMSMLVNSAVHVMDLKAAALRLLNPKTRTLDLLAVSGLSDKYVNKGPVGADQSIGEAMQGKTAYIRDATSDERAQYQQEAREEGIASILSVPLSLKGRVIGVLRLYTAKPREFLEDERHFAEALAEIGAIAIENARMYERIKKDYEEVIADIHSFVGYRRSI
jgi:signal transduction protein with GAF and PtsI domain